MTGEDPIRGNGPLSQAIAIAIQHSAVAYSYNSSTLEEYQIFGQAIIEDDIGIK